MFWGLILEPGKRYAQKVDNSFHVSMAALDTQGAGGEVTVVVEVEKRGFVMCNLSKQSQSQQALDLNFESGESVAFFTKGAKAIVHLSGYLIPEDAMMEEEDTSDEETENSLTASPFGKKRPANEMNEKQSKKQKINDILSGLKNVQANSKKGMEDSDDDEDDDDDEEDDAAEVVEFEEESDEEESDEEMSPPKKTPQATPGQKGDKGKKVGPGTPHPAKQVKQVQQSQTPQQKQKNGQGKKTPAQGNKTPALTPGSPGSHTPGSEGESAKKKKRNRKKSKKSLGGEPGTPQIQGTPSSAQQSQQTPKQLQTPKMKPEVIGMPKTPKTPSVPTPSKKTLPGGVMVEDLRMGNGPEAKSGRFVSVHYVGKLKQNNKQFDASNQGPGFKFRLGQGEVIKGWDMGVSGMKVGGKRRIICPPHMAYGKKGMLPAIPPNSTLVFDVELKAIN